MFKYHQLIFKIMTEPFYPKLRPTGTFLWLLDGFEFETPDLEHQAISEQQLHVNSGHIFGFPCFQWFQTCLLVLGIILVATSFVTIRVITFSFNECVCIENIWNRSVQHSMANFYREFPQLRCTELQLKMRLAGLHLHLKRVAHEQNTRLAVSAARECSRQISVLGGGVALWGCSRQANWVFNKLWQP